MTVLLALAFVGGCTPRPQPAPPHAPHPTPTTTVASTPTPAGVSQRGNVTDEAGLPIAGAVVRQQATENRTTTIEDGSFVLGGLPEGQEIVLTAWSEDYYVGSVAAIPGPEPVTITLRLHYTTDNPEYTWFSHEGAEGSLSCSHCMPCYEEWIVDAHSQSAVNPRFLTMYLGTDLQGNQSPPTRYGFSRDYGRFPLRPDPDQPYYGPGYRLDFPDTAGNCATCHVPAQAAYPGGAYAADPTQATGIELEGVFCELCHKIGEVTLDPGSGLPYPNMPGVLSMRLYRPEPEQQLFFGNFDDVARRVSYSPLYEQSQYCAPCHFGMFWDTVVYNSFGEWLDSPYADPETGQSCQDCHMPPVDYPYFVYPEQGGLIRDPSRIFSHRMPGASDDELLQNALSMSVAARRVGAQLHVEVGLTNDRTGHHIPTDSPLRHLILLVEATDASGAPLSLSHGPTLPAWCGVGDSAQGYYAGLPGTAYARILQELWTEVTPTGAYWNPTRVVSDNRLAALATDTTHYEFTVPNSRGPLTVEVTLLFRRAFIELMDQKGWSVPDILMESETMVVR